MLKVSLALVTSTDDISLACTTSLLKLQQAAAMRRDPALGLDIHIVSSLNDALNTIGDADFIAAIDANIGFDPELVFEAVTRYPDVATAGVYPLPKVDWDLVAARVKAGLESSAESSSEPLEQSGNVYNIGGDNGDSIEELRALIIPKKLLDTVPGEKYVGGVLYARESVDEETGVKLNQFQTLAKHLGSGTNSCIRVDFDRPCTLSGPAQFAGCVGMRRHGIR